MRQVCSSQRLRVAMSLLVFAPLAMAGRPLASEDASTADAGSCQLEAWSGRVGSAGSRTVAPACGLRPGLELDADHTVFSPRGSQPEQAGAALKWAPSTMSSDTALGPLQLGAKLSGAWARSAGSAWRATQSTALVIATLKPGNATALHANLGATRDHTTGSQASLLNLALVWAPHDALLLFAEVLGNSRRAAFGGTLRNAGARWWLAKDTLGLDLTAGREAGVPGTTRWTLGLGWYGIGL